MPSKDLRQLRAQRNKRSTTVYLEEDQHERLKALSERTRVAMAEYIRQAVDLILAGKTPLVRRNERLARLGELLEGE